MKKVVILSPGRQVYLIEQFKKYFSVVIADNSQYSLDTFMGIKKYQLPRYRDDRYADVLLSIVKNEKADFILSLNDIEIPIVSTYSAKIESFGCKVLTLKKEMATICLDKLKCSEWLRKNGIDTPATFKNTTDLYDAIKNGSTSYPFIAKERIGMGSRGIRIIHSRIELDELPEDLLDNYVFQEYIRGQEYGLDIVNNLDGHYFATVVKQKLNMANGETDAAIVVVNEMLEKIGKKLSSLFEHKGNMDCDVILSENGHAYVIDINPRFGGGYIFSLNAGMDVPYLISQWAESKEPAIPELVYNKAYRKITTLTLMDK